MVVRLLHTRLCSQVALEPPPCRAQVKLREMLHKGKKDAKGPAADEGQGAPDAYRTAVCCQVSAQGASGGADTNRGTGGGPSLSKVQDWLLHLQSTTLPR